MRINCFGYLPILVISGFLAATIPTAYADPAPSDQSLTRPQIVRISYVEGDVRIARGKLAEKLQPQQNGVPTGWEQAVANLPIASGYSIVTGIGRAEIEFEDSSTVYLADNSVLTFNQLTSTEGIPYTDLALLSGTATANVHPIAEGEWFKITTPSDSISLTYPRTAVWRIDSYLDAVSITPQRDPSLTDPALLAVQAKLLGKTSSYNHGEVVSVPLDPAEAAVSVKWDAWVSQRLNARDAAYAVTMKAAGLKYPVPGLAELKDQGHFFSCAPYGKCWEPTNGWDGKGDNIAAVSVKASPDSEQVALGVPAPPSPKLPHAKSSKPSASDTYLAAHPGATLYTEDFYFPCDEFAVQDVIAIDPATGKEKVIDTYFDLNTYMDSGWPNNGIGGSFAHRALFEGLDGWGSPWAICHAGSWIRWNHRYAWVAGTNRHYNCPVHWVRNGRNVGFVPIHPRDGAGKPPVNLHDGLFKVTGNRAQPFVRVPFEEGKPLTILSEPPRGFRKSELEPLRGADVPNAEAHSALEVAHQGAGPLPSREAAASIPRAAGPTRGASSELRSPQTRPTETKVSGSTDARYVSAPIIFDHKSESFSVARQVNVDGRSVTVMEHLGRLENISNTEQARGSSNAYSNVRNSAQPYNGSQSYSNGSSPSYSPSNNNSNSGNTNSYTPRYSAPSYSPPSNSGGGYSGGGSYSAPSPSPPPSPPPAPSYSPPASTPTPAGPVGR